MRLAVLTTLTILATAGIVVGLCFGVNALFLNDPAADSYMQTAEKLTGLSLYGPEALQRFRDEDEVTFDPTSGQRMGETLQYLKLSDRTNVLLVGASQIAFVAGDATPTYHTRRLDQVMERLSYTPIETYNLSSAGLNAAETSTIIEKATKRVRFDHVVVFILPHVLQYNTLRPAMKDLPDPSPDVLVASSQPSLLDRWLDPSAINLAVREAASSRLEEAVPFFRRRFPIQQWAAHELMRMDIPTVTASAGAKAETAASEKGTAANAALVFNDGAGLIDSELSRLSQADGPWKVAPPGVAVVIEHDAELGKDVAVFPGGYAALDVAQPVALSGGVGGSTITLRAKVNTADPVVHARIGFQIGKGSYMASCPADGEWHDLKVQFTLPYSSNDQVVTVMLHHGNWPRQEMRVADLRLTADEPQMVYQYYFVEETAQPILKNLQWLLAYLEGYRAETGATISLVVSPYYQDPENPVFQPEWLMDEFTALARNYAQDHGFHYLDARGLLPNSFFGHHSNRPVVDGVHFDGEGHKRMAAELMRLLEL